MDEYQCENCGDPTDEPWYTLQDVMLCEPCYIALVVDKHADEDEDEE